MPLARRFCWSVMFLLTGLWGCTGEVPTPDKTEKLESPDDSPPKEDQSTALKFTDFTAFLAKPAGDDPIWSVTESGVIQTTGTPRGYLYTNKVYENYTLEGEFRFVPPEETPDEEMVQKFNTGFLIHVPDEHKTWPRSLEVQGRYDEMGQVKRNARDIEFESLLDDGEARKAARKPLGEWNTIKIVSKAGLVTAYLNGKKISEGKTSDPTSGRIGLQAEDFPVEFRNLRIREE
ncbi:MAG: DUF1080 domain-containing protein [Planctomycetaceae bacterium]|nr:DUF1080 domain-containing protein [Planctomycetaceae bacterium]